LEITGRRSRRDALSQGVHCTTSSARKEPVGETRTILDAHDLELVEGDLAVARSTRQVAVEQAVKDDYAAGQR
jgi:hypothetical protein